MLAKLLEGVTVLPIKPQVAIMAPALALPHGDQFDRIIVGTAKSPGPDVASTVW